MKYKIIVFLVMTAVVLNGCQDAEVNSPSETVSFMESSQSAFFKQESDIEESNLESEGTFTSADEELQSAEVNSPSETVSFMESSQSVTGITEYIMDKTIVYLKIDIDADGIEERLFYDPYRHGVITEKEQQEVSFLDFTSQDIAMDFNASGFGKIPKGYRMIQDQTGTIFLCVSDGALFSDVGGIAASYFHSIFSWDGEKWVFVDCISYSKIEDYEQGTIAYSDIMRNGSSVNTIEEVKDIYTPIEEQEYWIFYS